MSVRMVRAKIKADKAAELEKASKEMFTAIEAAQPLRGRRRVRPRSR